MPFESQFALSLKVSRLLPLRLVADKTASAVIQLASSLQNSGSGIVIDEDLAEIFVEDDTWFAAIAVLLTGQAALNDPYLDNVSLLSARGWSVHLNIYGNDDHSTMEAGLVVISGDVPVRNEVRKHGIVDGPRFGLAQEDNSWCVQERVPQEVTLRNSNKVELLPVQCAERKDYFALNTRFLQGLSAGRSILRRSGFRDYYRCLWNVHVSKACNHSVQTTPKTTLNPGFITITGFPTGRLADEERYRVFIFLTAYDRAARWRALVSRAESSNARVMLRSQGCCLRCVVDQASLQPGRWYIVL